ncbi:MAG: hypothetical protein PHV33_04530 [Elusimicrobiales bacterium]|nr:hypothetical protein [Elusimicrobiales bacterium]
MQDNSSNRRKTLIVSVLAFLFAGGGIFLFFIVQGSNDLTRAGKNQNFSYGTAAREGVTSFFKSMGVIPEEEPKLSDAAVARNASRGLPLDELGIAASNPDMSDWMEKAPASSASGGSSRSASPASVPKMQAGGGSGLGGGGGGSKSAGSATRFGEGSAAGATSVSNRSQSGATGGEGKGTLATLKNTRALLGEGLRSGSAMTASAKWNQSFGLGSGSNRGGDMSYTKTGLVGLDKIKSGDIADLKMDKKGALKPSEVGNPLKDEEGTKKALGEDAKVQQAAKDKAEADMKKEAAAAAVKAAEGAMGGKSGTTTGAGAGAGTGTGTGAGGATGMAQLPEGVQNSINDVTCGQGCTTEDGDKYKDSSRAITVNQGPPPTFTCEFKGEQVNADGTVITYNDKVTYDDKGNVLGLMVTENPK